MTAALAVLASLALSSPTAPSARPPGGRGAEAVARAWSERAALATRRLSGTGLDACDRAVEKAFVGAKVKPEGSKVTFLLKFEVEGEPVPMLAAFGYDAGRLEDFVVVGLPPGWLIRQPTGSRTLSVLLKGCVFDLCPADPLASAPCP